MTMLMFGSVADVSTFVSAQTEPVIDMDINGADSGPELDGEISAYQAADSASVRNGGVMLDGDVHSLATDETALVEFSHTSGSGDNRLMLVGVSWNSGPSSVSSVSFDYGAGPTELEFSHVISQQAGTSVRYVEIWSLLAPPISTSGNVSVDFGTTNVTNGVIVGVANFSGVDQTTPLGPSDGATATSTTPSVGLTGLNGIELIFDTVFGGGASPPTLTVDPSQTELWQDGNSNATGAGSIEQATGSSVTMSWTRDSGLWAIAAVAINPVFDVTCYTLTLTSGLFGSPATPDPESSLGCPAGEYVEGEVVDLTANPDWGYEVQAWSNTDDDTSTALTNTVTMPAAAHTVNVNYQSRACHELTLNSGDHGGDPTADPTFSEACTLGNGWYVEGEPITLTAYPDSGYRVAGWTGTNDDSSKATTNTLTMPGAGSTVNVTYEEIPPGVSLDGSPSVDTYITQTCDLAHTIGTGTDRLLLVGISWNAGFSDKTINSVDFIYTPDGGVETTESLSEVITRKRDSGYRYAAIYSLMVDVTSIPNGQAGIVRIQFSAAVTNGVAVGAANFMGVDQTDPIGLTGGNDTSTVTLAGLEGDELVFDTVFDGGNPPGDISVGDGQTEVWNSDAEANTRGAASLEQATGSSVEMSWNEISTVNQWVHIAAAINPAIVGPTQDLTMAVNITESGTTTPAAGGTYTYAQNAVVPITATPATGYEFSHWTPDDTPGDPIANPYVPETTVTMDDDYTVTAHFAPITHNLSVSIVGNGTVDVYPENSGPYDYGTEIELTADADPGWLFTGWSGDLTGQNNPETIVMDGEKSVTATFIEMQPETVYLDGPPVYGVMESGSTISIDTLTGSGENRLMLVGVSYNSSTTNSAYITSVTFTPTGLDPLDLTLVIEETSPPDQTEDPGRRAAIYYLDPSLNPDPMTEGVLEVTFSEAFTTGAVAGVANFQGVDQTDPLGTPNGAGTAGNSDDELSVILTTSGNELVFDTIWTGGQPSWTMEVTAPQSELWNDGYQNTMGGASIKDADVDSTTMTWTRSNDGYMALVAVPINPVVEAGTGTIIVEKQTTPDGWTDKDFDFTGDATGSIGDGDQITVTGLAAGTYQVQEVVPAGWILESIVCDDTNSTEDLPNFEADIILEDDETVTCVFNNLLPLDYGDAPDSYQTLLASDGARHAIITGHNLGPIVDAEPDGQPSALADQDDLNPPAAPDDEDGVTFPTASLTAGDTAAQVDVDGGPSGGMLDAWIDFNGNGVFDHPSEHLWGGASQSVALSPTITSLFFTVPSDAVAGLTYARFRLSNAGGLLPYGFAPDGEVEDYQVEIILPHVTVTADAGQSKVYGATDPVFAYTPSEDVSFTGSLSRDSGEDVGFYAITIGTLSATGYVIDFVPADFEITARSITVTADDKSKTVGEGDPPLTYSITGGSLAFDDYFTGDLERDEGETVGTYGIYQGTLEIVYDNHSSEDSIEDNNPRSVPIENYDLNFIPGTFTINEVPTVNVTVDTGQSKAYGESDPTPFAYTADNTSVEFTGALSRETGEAVGTYAITQGTLAAAGYDIIFNAADFTITKRDIEVTADDVSKIVGHVDPSLTYSITNGSLAFSDAFTGALARESGEVIGTYRIFKGTLTLNANYNLTYIEGTFEIEDYPTVVVTADSGKTKIYGEDDPTLTYTYDYDISYPAPEFTGSLSRVTGEDVGTYAINQGDLDAASYYIEFHSADFEITPKVITVTADPQTKVYGEDDPELTYQHTPELIGEDSFSGELERAVSEEVGSYAIGQGTLSLGSNYTINFTGDDLNITVRPIEVTADDAFKYPGQVDPPLTYTITGGSLAFDDAFTGAIGRVAGESVGTYDILQLSLALNANYDLTFINGTFVIAESVKHDIDLVAGWNLVSFKIIPEDPDVEAILADIMDDVMLVYAWDGETGTWSRFDPAVGYGNTLEELHRTMGFWINMAEDRTLSITGVAPVSTSVLLYSGWNLIGWSTGAGEALPSALSDIDGNYELVMAHHASDTADPWKLFDPTGPAYANDLTVMDPGWGYWIEMNTDDTLNVDY